jgi:hypothetical protein
MTAFGTGTIDLPSSRVDQFLIKPFGMTELIEAIEKGV